MQTTEQRLMWIYTRLTEGDRQRLVKFGEAMLQQRQGKTRQRSESFRQRQAKNGRDADAF